MLYRDPFFRDVWGHGDPFDERREQVFDRPSKVFDQHFGSVLSEEDAFAPSASLYTRCRRPPKERSGVSSMVPHHDKFTMALDVQQFKPDELKVRVVEGAVEVEGRHEQRQDEHGTIARHFVRKYTLPEDVMVEMVASSLSPDGVLTIEAPKKPIELPTPSQRDVPIRKVDDQM